MITIIINATAGKGLGKEKIEILIQVLKEHRLEYRLHYSEYHGHVKILAAEYASCSTKIITLGGDGTIQEAIEGLISVDWPCPLAIIPTGTGNDFAKTLKIPLDYTNALHLALSGNEKLYYLGICNSKYFANVVSTGIDAEIVKNRLLLKKVLYGPLSYLISSILTILIYKPREYMIVTDFASYKGSYYLIAVGNGNFYGNGMNVTPEGSPSSKMLNLVLVRKTNRFRLLTLLPTIYTGKHILSPYAESILTSSVKITCLTGEQLINSDGELEKGIIIDICKTNNKLAHIVSL